LEYGKAALEIDRAIAEAEAVRVDLQTFCGPTFNVR